MHATLPNHLYPHWTYTKISERKLHDNDAFFFFLSVIWTATCCTREKRSLSCDDQRDLWKHKYTVSESESMSESEILRERNERTPGWECGPSLRSCIMVIWSQYTTHLLTNERTNLDDRWACDQPRGRCRSLGRRPANTESDDVVDWRVQQKDSMKTFFAAINRSIEDLPAHNDCRQRWRRRRTLPTKWETNKDKYNDAAAKM